MTQKQLKDQILSAPDYADPNLHKQWKKIARALVRDSAHIKKDQHVLLWYEEPALPLIKLIHEECEKVGVTLSYFMRDIEHVARTIPGLSEAEITSFCHEEYRLVRETDTSIIVRATEHPEALESVSKVTMTLYSQAYSRVHEPRIDGSRGWTLFYYPTRYEAKKEKLSYDSYVSLVLSACNQPWGKIEKAQEYLVQLLNNATTLRLVANPHDPNPNRRTDVTMSIEGMTFVNSTVENNYPGSEVFSAPVKESVNGHIFAEGAYLYSSHLMEDISFDIKNGKIIRAHARINNDGLTEILSRGEGARFFGEVALGTNPGLPRRFFNALLNEKVGGSFHMAVGHCYTFTHDRGVSVNVNNGNSSDLTPNHWDITISMRKAYGGGAVYVDGEMIQKDGKFLDRKHFILNS